jgi:hypothetical protein
LLYLVMYPMPTYQGTDKKGKPYAASYGPDGLVAIYAMSSGEIIELLHPKEAIEKYDLTGGLREFLIQEHGFPPTI